MLIGISVLLFFCGILFKIFKPKKKNSFYGYRTRLSRLSQSNWDEAQRYSSTLFIIVSIVLFIIGLLFNYISIPYKDIVSDVIILCGAISVIFFTEMHLKKLV